MNMGSRLNENGSGLYCNPVPLPDMPRGMACLFPSEEDSGYLSDVRDFRELADPEILFRDGKWYLFPSCAQAYVSEDLIHWEYHPIEIDHPLCCAFHPWLCLRQRPVYPCWKRREESPATPALRSSGREQVHAMG